MEREAQYFWDKDEKKILYEDGSSSQMNTPAVWAGGFLLCTAL